MLAAAASSARRFFTARYSATTPQVRLPPTSAFPAKSGPRAGNQPRDGNQGKAPQKQSIEGASPQTWRGIAPDGFRTPAGLAISPGVAPDASIVVGRRPLRLRPRHVGFVRTASLHLVGMSRPAGTKGLTYLEPVATVRLFMRRLQ